MVEERVQGLVLAAGKVRELRLSRGPSAAGAGADKPVLRQESSVPDEERVVGRYPGDR